MYVYVYNRKNQRWSVQHLRLEEQTMSSLFPGEPNNFSSSGWMLRFLNLSGENHQETLMQEPHQVFLQDVQPNAQMLTPIPPQQGIILCTKLLIYFQAVESMKALLDYISW